MGFKVQGFRVVEFRRGGSGRLLRRAPVRENLD